MRIDIQYKDGRMKFEGTPTDEERRLYEDLRTNAEKFYDKAKEILKGVTLVLILSPLFPKLRE